MEQNLPTCLTDVAPFSNFSSTTIAAPAEENSESDEEPDSDEDVPNEN